MAKQLDVTGNLHKIGNRIAESAKREAHDGISPAEEVRETASTEAAVQEKNHVRRLSAETEVALKKRHEEFIRLKKDLAMRITEASASVSAENVRLRNRIECYGTAETHLSELLKTVENTYEPDSARNDYQGMLADACKTLENARLELIRTTARLDKTDSSASSGNGKSNTTEMPLILNILDSMSFMQLFRIGTFIFLPIAGALLLTAFIIAVAIVAAMKL